MARELAVFLTEEYHHLASQDGAHVPPCQTDILDYIRKQVVA
jgi:hypothetical protein